MIIETKGTTPWSLQAIGYEYEKISEGHLNNNQEMEDKIERRKRAKIDLNKMLNSENPDEQKKAMELLEYDVGGWEGLEILKNKGISENEFRELFLSLWGAASCNRRYDKPAWGSIQHQLKAIGITT